MARSAGPSIGFVGLGGMGTTHATNVSETAASVAAGADVASEAREAFADLTGARTYENCEAMLEAESLDGIVVTTPNKFHERAAVGALERDVHVLCEKPLAHTLASAERIVRADRDSDAFCMVGFCNRFSRAATLYREYRRAGHIGDVEHIEANYVRRRGIPGVGSWFTDEDLAGGGALIDLGVHVIDLALSFAGYPAVEAVSGVTRTSVGGSDEYADPRGWSDKWATDDDGLGVEDAVSAFLRCADGVTISLEVAWAINRRSSKEIRVVGSEAGAELDVDGDTLTLLGAHSGALDHYDDRTLSCERPVDRHAAEAQRFVEAVSAGERPAVNRVEQGLAVQRVVDAIYRSAEAGRSIRLEDPDADSAEQWSPARGDE